MIDRRNTVTPVHRRPVLTRRRFSSPASFGQFVGQLGYESSYRANEEEEEEGKEKGEDWKPHFDYHKDGSGSDDEPYMYINGPPIITPDLPGRGLYLGRSASAEVRSNTAAGQTEITRLQFSGLRLAGLGLPTSRDLARSQTSTPAYGSDPPPTPVRRGNASPATTADTTTTSYQQSTASPHIPETKPERRSVRRPQVPSLMPAPR